MSRDPIKPGITMIGLRFESSCWAKSLYKMARFGCRWGGEQATIPVISTHTMFQTTLCINDIFTTIPKEIF